MEVLAIIPARGGSKGIPGKNIIPLNGKPMVSYSIRHALDSEVVNRVVVSSDHKGIIACAKEYGAEVPFIRPSELAQDDVLDWPVFVHALEFLYQSEGYRPDIIVHLRPTTPIRKAKWIDDAVRLLLDNPNADSVRSVSKPAEHPYRMFSLDEAGYLNPIMKTDHPKPYELRRQEHPDFYHYNCVLDVTRYETVMNMKSMTGDRMLPYIMRPEDVVDVDTPKDLEIVKILYKEWL